MADFVSKTDHLGIIFNRIKSWIIATFQPLLVSGTNIKTINNQSILGSGNINISGSGGISGTTYGGCTYAIADGFYDAPNDSYFAIPTSDSVTSEHMNPDRILSTVFDCYRLSKNKLSNVVVNKCIPISPKRGMTYYFQDGVIKVISTKNTDKHNTLINIYSAIYNSSTKQWAVNLHASGAHADKIYGQGNNQINVNAVFCTPVLVYIKSDGLFSLNNCEFHLCPSNTIDTTCPKLKIIDKRIVNVYELQTGDKYRLPGENFAYQPGSTDLVGIEHYIKGAFDNNMKLVNYATGSYFTYYKKRIAAHPRRRTGAEEKYIRISYKKKKSCIPPDSKCGKFLVRSIVRGHKSKGYMVKLLVRLENDDRRHVHYLLG